MSPLLADLVIAFAPVALLLDPSLYPNPPPMLPPFSSAGRPILLVLVPR